MIYKLPDNKANFPKELNDKILLLKNKKSTFVSNGAVLADKEAEWNLKYTNYLGKRTRLDGLEEVFRNHKMPDGKYADSIAELRRLEFDVEYEEKDLLTMIAEPFNRPEIEKALIKAKKLVGQTLNIRPAKSAYKASRLRK